MKVLISPNYGGGFSTWGDSRMAVDKDIIALFERGCTCEEMEELCRQKEYIDEYGFVCGFEDLIIKEVPPHSFFRIREYDGHEWIEVLNLNEWILSD